MNSPSAHFLEVPEPDLAVGWGGVSLFDGVGSITCSPHVSKWARSSAPPLLEVEGDITIPCKRNGNSMTLTACVKDTSVVQFPLLKGIIIAIVLF